MFAYIYRLYSFTVGTFRKSSAPHKLSEQHQQRRKYIPGGYFEMSFAITPGKVKSFIQVINLGFNGAVYAKALPIMVDQTASIWQVNIFAGLVVGKKWR